MYPDKKKWNALFIENFPTVSPANMLNATQFLKFIEILYMYSLINNMAVMCIFIHK